MPYWQVHFLNARHDLTGIMPELRTAIADSVALASDHLPLVVDLRLETKPAKA